MDYRDKAIADTANEIKKEGEARRAKAKTQPRRPAKYQYSGLEERTTVLMPEVVNPDEYDIIGKDVTRILHRRAAKVWVEVVERPIMRFKADKELPPHRIEHTFRLARAQEKLGNTDAALQLYDTTIAAAADDDRYFGPYAALYAADIMLTSGNNAAAQRYAQQAQKLNNGEFSKEIAQRIALTLRAVK